MQKNCLFLQNLLTYQNGNFLFFLLSPQAFHSVDKYVNKVLLPLRLWPTTATVITDSD